MGACRSATGPSMHAKYGAIPDPGCSVTADDGAHAKRERNAAANGWANTSRALCFESVVFGARSQPLLTFRKGLLPLAPTESNFNSPSRSANSTSAISKTEKGYEEGCARGGCISSPSPNATSAVPYNNTGNTTASFSAQVIARTRYWYCP